MGRKKEKSFSQKIESGLAVAWTQPESPMKTQKIMLWPPRDFQWRCQLEWKLQDFWIGAFWKRQGNCIDLWLCLLPCVPLHISWWWTQAPMTRAHFLKLPMEKRRELLKACVSPEMVKYYEGVNDV
jgi:hypothetical protein